MATEWMAACGLDCESCSIRRIPFDDEALKECVVWFREMGWLKEGEGKAEILERGMYCNGCKGDRTVHWSISCAILECCVDQRNLSSCSECGEFPCQRLTAWSKTNDRYAEAFARLQKMRKADF